MRKFGISIVILLLSGCVSFQPSIPIDYVGKKATLSDSYSNHEGSTAHFYVLTKIDGRSIEDSGYRTRVNNHGRGFNMTPYMVSRDTTIEEHVFTVAGFVQFATDAQGMFGDSMLIEKEVILKPEANQVYVVKGELSKNGSNVWIEDKYGIMIRGKQVSKN